uniref:Uncharacterized protein LOC100184299 n=1 Tax=Phallusia mammillata TaxID=59560 RepID=A0A6F9DIS5_9ASCI|nr:uncharacterized protein LOC100184299 [Phallusia mammillata]
MCGSWRKKHLDCNMRCRPLLEVTRAGDLLSESNSEEEKWIGKVRRPHGCLYVPYGGKEYVFSQHEVLCRNFSPADLASVCRWNIVKYLRERNSYKNAISKLPLPENLKLYIASF